MKNSKEYAQKVQKLYRSLKRSRGKVEKVMYEDPVDALIYAVVSERLSEAESQAALKRFRDYFVDWNELRVSRVEEIAEILGVEESVARETAATLTRALMAVFKKYNVLSLESLKKMGKRPARQVLEKIEQLSPYAIDYCMLTALKGHAIPLTERMIEYLKTNDLVHADADRQQIEGFLARLIPAAKAYEFYALLRYESEHRKTTGKAKVRKAKKKTKIRKAKK